jgi:MraZ protein
MSKPQEFILGEFPRTLDERHRVSIPQELTEILLPQGGTECILAKERPGCLSLWNAKTWQGQTDQAVELVKSKMRAGKLEGRLDEVQRLARLLSTRHRLMQLADRGRLLIPDGFREFLQVEAGGEVIVVGAAVCVEIWKPRAWMEYLEGHMPDFRQIFDRLSS